MNNSTKWIIGILTGLVIVLIIGITILYKDNKDNKNDYNALKTALDSKFTTFTNKQGQQIAQVQAAVFANSNDFKDAIKQLNTGGANIQSKIYHNTQGLILLDKQVGGLLTGKTSVGKNDTVTITEKTKAGKDTTERQLFPEYTINDSTKWYKLKGVVGYNKYSVTPLFYDSTELMPTNINGGFFKKSVLGVQSLNKSPYAHTTGLKYLQLKKTPAPVWKVIGGIAIFAGGFYIGHHL